MQWGCGTSCGSYVIIDASSGQTYEPPELVNVELGVAGPEYRLNSTLLVLANCPPPEVQGNKDCEKKFYKWDGSRLILLKGQPVSIQVR